MFPADLAHLRIPAAPSLSPDGRQVVAAVSRIDLDDNTYRSDLWLTPTDGSAPPRRFTSGKRDGRPRFSPDGRWIAFLRAADDDDKPQLHVTPADGGEARRVCEHPLGAEAFAWSPDSTRLAYVARVPDIPELAAWDETQEDALKKVRKAIRANIEIAHEYGDPVPEPSGC